MSFARLCARRSSTVCEAALIVLLTGAMLLAACADPAPEADSVPEESSVTHEDARPQASPTFVGVTPPAAGQELPRLTLVDAWRSATVEIEFTGRSQRDATGRSGGFSVGVTSGAAIRRRVRRLTDQAVRIVVPPGSVLLNQNGGEQDMVLRRLGDERGGSSSIVLADRGWQTYIFEAYCIEAHDENPSSSSAFTLSPSPDRELAWIFDAADRALAKTSHVEANEILAVQAAVWAVTDDISRSEMTGLGYVLSDEDFALVKEILLGAELDPDAFLLFRGRRLPR